MLVEGLLLNVLQESNTLEFPFSEVSRLLYLYLYLCVTTEFRTKGSLNLSLVYKRFVTSSYSRPFTT